MNDDLRAERIHLRNIQLQALAFSETEPDPQHLLTVAIVFEARGELLRLEDWGNPWLRKFPARAPRAVLEALVASYREELKSLPLYRVSASDPDSSQVGFSLSRREDIESALLILQAVVLEGGRPLTHISGFRELRSELQAWDLLVEELVDPRLRRAACCEE